MAANTNTTRSLNLNPQMLYCVKSGLPLVAFGSNAKGDTECEALQNLNGMLAGGQLYAGVNAGRLFISDEVLKAHCETNKMRVPKRLFWGGRRKDGSWKSGPGQVRGAHNIAVLKAFGFSADPKTLTKGTVGNRRYGVFAEPEAKPAPVVQSTTAPLLAPPVKAPVSIAKPAKPKADDIVIDPASLGTYKDCPLPSPEEMTGRGAYGRYVGNCKKAGFSREEANEAWRFAKQHIQPKASEPAIAKPEPVKAKPQAVQAEAKPTATTIKVPASALQALLASVSDAEIKSYDAATNTFVVVS